MILFFRLVVVQMTVKTPHWNFFNFYRMKIYPLDLIQIALMKEMKMIGATGEEICLVLCVFFAPPITQIFLIYSITWTLSIFLTMENWNQVSAWTFTSRSRCGDVRKKKMISFPQTKIISNLSSADKLNGCVNLYFLSLEFKPAVDICKKWVIIFRNNWFQKNTRAQSKYHGSKNSALNIFLLVE